MRKAFPLALLAVLSAGVVANAESITYTGSAVASGSLNGVSFQNALVTLTGTGDTAAVVEPSTGLFQNVVTVEGTVAGLGSFTVTVPTDYFSNESTGATGVSGQKGFFGADILDTYNSVFDTYDLQSAIGPITGESAINDGESFATTAGNLILTSAGDSTFQATVGAVTTPEPSAFLLLGTGLLGFAGVARRRMA